jgi:tetratricopeptide (TPR) repeat protein
MEYARERLDAGEGDEFRRSAVEYWAEFARWHGLMMDVRPAAQESAAKLLSLPEEPEEREMVRSESFAMLAMDEDNIVNAAEWALHAGDEVGIGIVDALEDYLRLSAGWYTQEQLYRLALALRRRLAESDPEEYTPDVAMTLNNMGVLLDTMGDPDAALVHYQEALEIYRKLSESHPDAYMPDVAGTLNNIGVLLRNTGDPDAALRHYEEALEIRRKFYQRYPSAYARDLLQTLKNATEVYEKLKMEERAAECRREMEEITGKTGEK